MSKSLTIYEHAHYGKAAKVYGPTLVRRKPAHPPRSGSQRGSYRGSQYLVWKHRN